MEIGAFLTDLDVSRHFDAIYNSADIGHAKPDVRAFAHACAALDLPPERVAFTDDSPAKLAGARERRHAVAHLHRRSCAAGLAGGDRRARGPDARLSAAGGPAGWPCAPTPAPTRKASGTRRVAPPL